VSEQVKITLIIIVSVSILGLLVFVLVKNYLRKKLEFYLNKKKKKKKL